MNDIGKKIVEFYNIYIGGIFSGNVSLLERWTTIPTWVKCSGLFAICFKVYTNYKWSYWKKRGIEGPTPSVMKLGNLAELIKHMSDGTLSNWAEPYGNRIGIYSIFQPIILVDDTDILHQITIKQFSKFSTRKQPSGFDTLLGPLSKDFLTVVQGDLWHRIRSSTSTIMTQNSLTGALALLKMAANAVVMQEIEENKDIELKKLAGNYTLKAIMSSAFSVDPFDKDAMDIALLHANNIIPKSSSFSKMGLLAMIPEKIRFYFGWNLLPTKTENYFINLFDHLFKQYSSGNGRPEDLSSKMMNNVISDDDKLNPEIKKGFTKSELMSTSLLFILAGHETTASSLQFVLIQLARNPKIQNDLFENIQTFDVMSYENLRNLKLLDGVIKEVLRIFPPTPVLTRYCNETTEVSDSLTIHKGEMILSLSLNIHMNPEIYDNPQNFDPSRWEGNESNTLRDKNWLAFGHGPRSCPGVRLAYLTMKIFVVTLLKSYEIVLCENSPKDVKQVLKNMKVVSEQDLIVRFKKRV